MLSFLTQRVNVSFVWMSLPLALTAFRQLQPEASTARVRLAEGASALAALHMPVQQQEDDPPAPAFPFVDSADAHGPGHDLASRDQGEGEASSLLTLFSAFPSNSGAAHSRLV